MRTTPSGWGLGYSRVMGQTHAHWDSKKAPSSSTSTSSSVTQQVGRFSCPIPFPTSLPLLAKRHDRCWTRWWGPIIPIPPSHSWASCTGDEGWDFRSNTPAKHLHSSQLWLNTQWTSSGCCNQGVRWVIGRTANY